MADWASTSPDQSDGHAEPGRRAARAWERAAAVENRGARDPGGGLAFHWAAHSWRRCAAACEHSVPPGPFSPSGPPSSVGAGFASAWEAVADAWEAAAAAWLAVATAQRHLDASRAAEDRPIIDEGRVANSDVPSGDVVSASAAAVAVARRFADEQVRAAERCERDASAAFE
jgi:hypothetical protein